MKIHAIIGTLIVIAAWVWMQRWLKDSPHPTLAIVLFFIIAIPILAYLWMKSALK